MFALSLATSFGLGACNVSVDYGETAFACSAGECPNGYSCRAGMCIDESVEPPVKEADATVNDPVDAAVFAACDDAFAVAPGYQLCSEDETSCRFNVATAGGTCAEACEMLGSTCLSAEANEDVDLCLPIADLMETCDSPRNSEICVCQRLPAAGSD